MHGLGVDIAKLKLRVLATDYLTVAQLFLQNNFLLNKPLSSADIKPRLLGHWGTCHGINLAYANLKAFKPDFQFVLGPGHGFPALQSNLFIDGDLLPYYPDATPNLHGIEYICKNFSWPYGFPSHASPATPHIILEGGELGYCLGTAYGASLGQAPDRLIACLIGDGEMETAALLASLNVAKLLDPLKNAKVLPILHLNGYKISAPTLYARKSERELNQLLRGFSYEPINIDGENPEEFQLALDETAKLKRPFLVMKTQKGATGPKELHGEKIAGNYLAHQIPLPQAKTDPEQLSMLENWLKSYNFKEFYDDFTRSN
jgi:xylulose-5-phosphate/fructose-6-phosphate phosphoketolase